MNEKRRKYIPILQPVPLVTFFLATGDEEVPQSYFFRINLREAENNSGDNSKKEEDG